MGDDHKFVEISFLLRIIHQVKMHKIKIQDFLSLKQQFIGHMDTLVATYSMLQTHPPEQMMWTLQLWTSNRIGRSKRWLAA